VSDPFGDIDTSATRMRLDSADYELLWPRELLIRELSALRATRNVSERAPMIERLLDEAFLGKAPVQDYEGATSWPGSSVSASRRYDYVTELLARVPQLREHRRPAPYWSRRHNLGDRTPPKRDLPHLRQDFAQLISTFQAAGYFARDLPKICVDDPTGVVVNPRQCSRRPTWCLGLVALNPDLAGDGRLLLIGPRSVSISNLVMLGQPG
jgi:hypothetical protein